MIPIAKKMRENRLRWSCYERSENLGAVRVVMTINVKKKTEE